MTNDEKIESSDEKIESSDDEEKLSFNQKMLARMAYGMEKMDSTFGLFFSQSCENSNATNSLLKALVSKVETNSNRLLGIVATSPSSSSSLQRPKVSTSSNNPEQNVSLSNSNNKRQIETVLSPIKRLKSSSNSSPSDKSVGPNVILTVPIIESQATINEHVQQASSFDSISLSSSNSSFCSNAKEHKDAFLNEPIFEEIVTALN